MPVEVRLAWKLYIPAQLKTHFQRNLSTAHHCSSRPPVEENSIQSHRTWQTKLEQRILYFKRLWNLQHVLSNEV